MFSEHADKVGNLIWETQDGREVKIKDMDYFHLRNALKYVNKRHEECFIYCIRTNNVNANIMCLLLNAWAMVLQKELWNREEHKATDKVLQYWGSKRTDMVVREEIIDSG